MPLRHRSVDPRAERVRAQLYRAALVLVHERPVDEITVGDLVTRAEVSRQVFYRHFRDRDDAVATALGRAFAEAVADADEAADARRRIRVLFDFVADHRAVYRNVVPSSVFARVVTDFRAALQPACEQIAAEGMAVLAPIAPLPVDSVTRFLIGGFTEVLRSSMEDPAATDVRARVDAALRTVDVLLGIAPTPERTPDHG
ncbi:TetR family transcriptional regulator [Mycolicibacterium duvalii]|uniref:TetR family transcriptional regulator n=1 Tax=Mycolicibacterium duvalii TaxID=39688 RepID=A0A7I7JX22_9MYCO|nr:TetR/AcrR family transcriptional regulator [Mycolicibacterium duvalii]MCV7369659.1 TetR family transcriptional regulator [Mycolicibacterium duvalii]PEG36408.1 TetR family transcriptional regulator [Mycolicibacterium duvalii]BBX16386.1 TetR family transcriptional regulator [Mycolicibacterium duvalii]